MYDPDSRRIIARIKAGVVHFAASPPSPSSSSSRTSTLISSLRAFSQFATYDGIVNPLLCLALSTAEKAAARAPATCQDVQICVPRRANISFTSLRALLSGRTALPSCDTALIPKFCTISRATGYPRVAFTWVYSQNHDGCQPRIRRVWSRGRRHTTCASTLVKSRFQRRRLADGICYQLLILTGRVENSGESR